jgi:predicted DCC family thiol-disulfide oxidoreductase YuxK
VPETPLPSEYPAVVFDGDCVFCRRWVRRYWNLKHDGIAFASYQNASQQYPAISDDDFRSALHVIEPDGTTRRGAAACWRVLQLTTVRSWPLWLHEHIPPFRMIGDAAYRWVTRHRGGMNTVSTVLHGNVAAPSTALLTRRVFLRLLGLIYLAAFLSAGSQLKGLVGSEGIRPAAEHFAADVHHLPSLLALSSSDGMLQTLWIVGAIASVLLCLGLLPMAMLALCWIAYLSIVNGGDIFFNYQWDALLLEVGFLSIFWAPWHWRLNAVTVRRPSAVVRLMLLWLLARFMFFSGYVKLQSGDVTWLELTALEYHYWTQPLPTWTAWYMDGAAQWFQKASCIVMFAAELLLPLLVFGPRMIRLIAFVGLAGLQLAIMATGNYGFFNLLSLVLCILLLDDAQLLLLWPRSVRSTIRFGLRDPEGRVRRLVNSVIVALLLILTLALSWTQLTRTPVLQNFQESFQPYRIANKYGLFRSMTTTRAEIRIEASLDGDTWKPYVFIDKPGPLDRAPTFCIPNMPRLDWQMWFDGLYAQQLPHYPAIQQRMILPDLLSSLARNDAAVLALLESAPFRDEGGPAYLRWSLDHYEFTTAQQRSASGNWWVRRPVFTSGVMDVKSMK